VPLEKILVVGPGPGNDEAAGGEDRPLRTHFFGILGSYPKKVHPTLPDFCDADKSWRSKSRYTMELKPVDPLFGGIPDCYAIDKGGVANNGLITLRHRVNDLNPLPPVRVGKVSDGMSKTAMVGESAFGDPENRSRSWYIGLTGEWAYNVKSLYEPINIGCRGNAPWVCTNPSRNVMGFGSEHPGGGAHFVMGDGSVHFLSENIQLVVYLALGSRSADDLVSDDVFN
jgi:hypothetical protein